MMTFVHDALSRGNCWMHLLSKSTCHIQDILGSTKKKKKNSWQNCFALYFFELYAIYASAYFILELFWLAVKEVHTSISLTSILSLLPPLFPILSPPSSATLHTSSLYFPLTLFLSHLYSPSLSAVVSPCRSFYWLQRCCDGVLLTARTHSLW